MNALKLYLHLVRLALYLKAVSGYRATLRANVRALWNGTWDIYDFTNAMTNSIIAGLNAAFDEGLARVGGTPADVSPAERRALRLVIDNELAQVDGFGDAVEAGSKANGGKLGDHFARLELWIRRYPQVVEMGALAGGKDEDNYVWLLGRTEKHCPECATLHGVVASKAAWDASGLKPKRPPNPRLTCGGWRCDCTLSKTDLPATKGGIPRV